LKIFNSKNKNFINELKIFLNHRSEDSNITIDKKVKHIIQKVKLEGDKALFGYTKKFEGISLNKNNILINTNGYKKNKKINNKVKISFKKAIQNITNFHKKQLPKNYSINQNDSKIGSIWKPIESVGIYVPGGKSVYPSSLIMSLIPAIVAGVKRIVVTTPTFNKKINPYILYLLDLLGVKEAYKVGGAQAIAALAFGTESIKSVNKIFGPGNAYVASAKKQVFGKVGIDLIAGPSEIVILAGNENNPKWVAADLIAQAEHDERAQSILITNSTAFANKVTENLKILIKTFPKKNIISKSLKNFGAIIIIDNFSKAHKIINLIAPEHLHLQNKESFKVYDKISNAGAIFIGEYSAEAYGDYIIGTNHILPTSGSAKFSSGLGVLDFMKRTSYVKMTKKSSNNLEKYVSSISSIENLKGHEFSVKIRQKDKK